MKNFSASPIACSAGSSRPGGSAGKLRPLDLRRDVVEIETGDQRGDRRDEEDRPDHEREPAEPFDRGLDPVGPVHEIAEPPDDADNQKDEKPDREAHAFDQHGAKGRREQFLEGLTCGSEHDVLPLLAGGI